MAGVHGRLRRLSPAGSRLQEPAGERVVAFPRGGSERAVGAASRARWRALYQEVRRRRAAGQGLRQIAREMELGRGTVPSLRPRRQLPRPRGARAGTQPR